MTGSTLAPFEADILDELLAAQRDVPDGVASRHRSRRRVAVTLTVAAAVGGAATIAVVANDGTSSPTRAETPTTRPPVRPGTAKPVVALTVAVITRRAAASMAKVDNLVVHLRETRTTSTPAGSDVEVYESWWDRGDPAHSRTKYTHNGLPVYDIQRNEGGRSERYVDFARHAWYESPPVSTAGHGVLLGWTPDVVRKLLHAKGLTLVGHETINGRDTLHLARHDIAPIPGDLWIDPTTYLIVRSSNPIATTDYEWLPRTSATLSKLVPVIPPGFAFGGPPPETSTNSDGSNG